MNQNIDRSAHETPIYRGLDGVYVESTTICEIDDERNSLRYRGYDVADLAKEACFEDVVHLLLFGEMPSSLQRDQLSLDLDQARALPPHVAEIIDLLPLGTTPMAVIRTAVSALGRGTNHTSGSADVRADAVRLIAQLPLVVGRFHARARGAEAPAIARGQPHAATVLSQFTSRSISDLDPSDVALVDKLLIIHAEHELNASCFAARVAASTLTDLSAAITAAVSTLAGSLHGGANERVLRTAKAIGAPEKVEDFVREAFAAKQKIHGFGQRGCRAEDPRAILLLGLASELAERRGGSEILPILLAMNAAVREHRELWPNVDFYSAAILHDLGIETDLFTPLFTCSRVSGWSAHVGEQLADNRLIRPKALYIGPEPRGLS